VDTLKHRRMFTHRQTAKLAKLPQRVIDPRLARNYGRCGVRFIFHAQNATVCSPA